MTDDLKKRYAEVLATMPADPFAAALQLFPGETAKALQTASELARDPEVLRQMDAIAQDKGEEALLPSKADLCREVWERMKKAEEERDFANLARLYGDIRGFIQRPNEANQMVNVIEQKVMIVKDHGTNDEWEDKLKKQQHNLINAQYERIE